jgi:hypothetical protein
MIPDDLQALALADAIGALDPDERRDLEARLAARPPNVRAEVCHLYDASVEIDGRWIEESVFLPTRLIDRSTRQSWERLTCHTP